MKLGIGIFGIVIAVLFSIDMIYFRVCMNNMTFASWYLDNAVAIETFANILLVILILYSLVIGVWLIKKHLAKKEV